MDLVFILVFCIVSFGLYLAVPMHAKSMVAYLIAIGSIVNAPIFNCFDYPFEVFGIHMGLDSVVYLAFIFTVYITYAYNGKKQAGNLIFTSVAAVLFAAFIQLLASWAASSLTKELGFNMLKFVATAISSAVVGLVMFYLYDLFKAKRLNLYLNATLCMVLAGVAENIVFYGLLIAFGFINLNGFLSILGGLYLGKAIGLVFALLVIFISQKFKKGEQIDY